MILNPFLYANLNYRIRNVKSLLKLVMFLKINYKVFQNLIANDKKNYIILFLLNLFNYLYFHFNSLRVLSDQIHKNNNIIKKEIFASS